MGGNLIDNLAIVEIVKLKNNLLLKKPIFCNNDYRINFVIVHWLRRLGVEQPALILRCLSGEKTKP